MTTHLVIDDAEVNNVGLLALCLHRSKLLKASLAAVFIATFIFPFVSMITRRLDSGLAWDMSIYMLTGILIMVGLSLFTPISLQQALMILPEEHVPEELKGYAGWLHEYYVVSADSSLSYYLSLLEKEPSYSR